MKTNVMMMSLVGGGVATFILLCASAGAQTKVAVNPGPISKRQTRSITDITNHPQSWQTNKTVQNALAHSVRVTATGSAPGGDGGYSALIGLLRKQSAAARSLLLPAVNGGARLANGQSTAAANAMLAAGPSQGGSMLNGSVGTNQPGTLLNPGTARGLNPQPYPPKGTPQVGTSQTMSAPGNSSGTAAPATGGSSATPKSFNLAPAPPANPLTPTNGPTPNQATGGRQPQAMSAGGRATPTQLCRAGIATVDGGANGVTFSPVPGQDGQFVIQGCGFGNTKGEVYLSGVQYDPTRTTTRQPIAISTCSGCVYFQVAPNAWSDRQIVVQIDPNAGGLYDTNNVTLNVKTASGQIYQLAGMNFSAVRADQLLQNIPLSGVKLAKVSSSEGDITPGIESPHRNADKPGSDTVSVDRADIAKNFPIPAAPGGDFPGGTDSYQLNLAPGFQLDPHTGVQLLHTSLDVGYCQSAGGVYSSNGGQWAVNYTSTSSFQVFWGEDGCWPKTPITRGTFQDILLYGSVSIYELQITVLGPRGANPFRQPPFVIKKTPFKP